MAWNSDFMGNPPDTGENPGKGAMRIRETKEEIQTVINKEHYLGTGGPPFDFQSRHRQGSAVALKADLSVVPENNPFGSTWKDVDMGRLYINTDETVEDSTKGGLVYADTQDGGDVTLKALFEDCTIADDVDASETLTTLQDKLNGLAHMVKTLSGADSWETDPTNNINALETDMNTAQSDITTNAGNISTNTGDITALEGLVDQDVTVGSSPTFATVTLSTPCIYASSTLAPSSAVTIPKGFIAVGAGTSATPQIKDSGGIWRSVDDVIYSDGVNMRFYNSTSGSSSETQTYAYVRITV